MLCLNFYYYANHIYIICMHVWIENRWIIFKYIIYYTIIQNIVFFFYLYTLYIYFNWYDSFTKKFTRLLLTVPIKYSDKSGFYIIINNISYLLKKNIQLIERKNINLYDIVTKFMNLVHNFRTWTKLKMTWHLIKI